jgi:hypothetical protein
VTGDVLKNDPSQSVAEFSGDTRDVWPEVSGIIGTLALPRHAERLARIASQQGVDCASKACGVECGKIIPDRGGGEVSGPLGCDDG